MTTFLPSLISMFSKAFKLFEIQFLGVPLYVVFVFVFVMSSLASFLHGRKG